MTEITKIKVLPFDPVAFALALILAPLLVTLITFIAIIPVFALVLGAPMYLIMATPTLLWMVGRFPPFFVPYALAGFLMVLLPMIGAAAVDLIRPDLGADGLMAYLSFGTLFAPLWVGTFAPLYRVWNRMARPIPRF